MPSFTWIEPNLVEVGPVVEVLITPSSTYVDASAAGRVVEPVRASMLVDTGASGSVVNRSIIDALGLNPVGAPMKIRNIQGLIGRDILRHDLLTYIGHINQFTLSF